MNYFRIFVTTTIMIKFRFSNENVKELFFLYIIDILK